MKQFICMLLPIIDVQLFAEMVQERKSRELDKSV